MLWPFKKTDVQVLCQDDAKDRAHLRELENQREKCMPEYRRLQEECELIAARIVGHASTSPVSTDFNEGLFTPLEVRGRELKVQLDEAIRQRDGAIRDVNLEIFSVRSSIIVRNGKFISPVSGWLSKIKNMIESAKDEALNKSIIHASRRAGWPWQLVESGLADGIIADLQRARNEIDGMSQSPVSDLIAKVDAAIERVEGIPGFDGPLCRLDSLTADALELAPAATVS